MKKSGYTLTTRLTNDKTTDLSSALTKCAAAKATCQGVVKEGDKEFYLYKDIKLTAKSSHTTYLLGDDVVTATKMTVSSGGYSWTYQNPFRLTGTYGKKYTNKDDALAACASKSTTITFQINITLY